MLKKQRLLLALPVGVLAIAVLMLTPLRATAAMASPNTSSSNPHFMGKSVVQTTNAGPTGVMFYGGGPVMTGTVRVNLIFWLPKGHSFSKGYQQLLERFFGDFGQSSVFGVIHQYINFQDQSAQNVRLGSVLTDTTAFPGSKVLDSQIQAEVQKEVQQNKLQTGLSNIFFVYTPADEPVCFNNGTSCSTNVFCAYHDSFSAHGQTFLYGSIPDERGGGIPASPNQNISADGSIDARSHDLMEAMSDAEPNSGWSNPTLGEIGDPCAHTYGPMNAQKADIVVNGHPYLIQPEFSNRALGCSMS